MKAAQCGKPARVSGAAGLRTEAQRRFSGT